MIVVIALALFAFIAGDLFNKGNFGSSSKDVGSVNGKDIPFEEFRIKVSNVEKSQQGVTPTAAANRVWEQEVSIALLTAEFEKLGLRVGSKHIMEVLKADQNIGKNPIFLNTAGVFDEAKFKEYFKSNPEQAQYLKDREKDAELNAKYQIYNNLIKAGLYTTESEGKLKYEMEANKVNFAYVAGLYSSIKDSQVKISDDEIVTFMKKNEKRYKADETREVEYVLIEDKASPADEAEGRSWDLQLALAVLDASAGTGLGPGNNDDDSFWDNYSINCLPPAESLTVPFCMKVDSGLDEVIQN
jgi:peptidyl-prolyl cis-trans isomerase D